MKYTNHFAEQSDQYLQYRPDYPKSLFDYLASLTKQHDLAWDCAAGNGQAAVSLAERFSEVIATDINQSQLNFAPKAPNICYHLWPAEKTEIASNAIDLITVAQALHWFDHQRFYQEVRRVLKPDGVLAAWCYSLVDITPEINLPIAKLYFDILGDEYWPKERKYIDEKYETIPFPFPKLTAPEFMIEKNADFSQLMGYLHTWSAVKEYQQRNQRDPIELIHAEIATAWGDPKMKRVLRWPIYLLVGLAVSS